MQSNYYVLLFYKMKHVLFSCPCLITVEQQIGNDLHGSLQIAQLYGLQNYLIAFAMSAKGYMKAKLANGCKFKGRALVVQKEIGKAWDGLCNHFCKVLRNMCGWLTVLYYL